MAKQNDILLDEEGDLLIQNGDFAIGDNEFFHIKTIVEAAKGWWKQYPYLGSNIIASINGEINQAKIQEIRLNLESDGFKVKKIKVEDGSINIEATK